MTPRLWRNLLAAGCASLAIAAGAATIELTHARATITVDGSTTVAEVTLPYHLDQELGTRPARATFELNFSGLTPSDELYGLYLPRVGNAAEIWLNDGLLEQFGDLRNDNLDDFSKAPQYVAFPAQLLRPDNSIRIHVRADGGRRAGLSALVVGPDRDVRPLYERNMRWRMGGSVAIAVFSLLVGTLALFLWATHVDGPAVRDGIYLSAGVAEFCWALRVGDIALEHPPLAWPAWGVLLTAAFAGWMCGIALFCHNVAGWHRHPSMAWMRIGLLTLFVSSILASAVSLTLWQPVFLTAWLACANLFFGLYAVIYLAAALRAPAPARLLLALAGILNVAVGVRDWWAIRLSGDYAQSTWIRYSSVLFGLALGYIIITRFRAVSDQARDLMANLASRVAEKQQELSLGYARLDRLRAEHERAAERTRILHDMNEGVGPRLDAAIREIEGGAPEPGRVLQSLRESLDQLKLSIDAINLPPGNVTALLASLRYRLEPRFAASNVKLQWDVDALSDLPGFDGAAMRHLQFILFEALSNVLKHAHAKVLRIEARGIEPTARLRIIDDGRGFAPHEPPAEAIRAMRERAAAIGATLSLASQPGCTVVEIVLPYGAARDV